MNRYYASKKTFSVCVPHWRGDEPDIVLVSDLGTHVFPTGVGMNCHPINVNQHGRRVPHRHGDKLSFLQLQFQRLAYIPRWRGG